MWWANTVVMPLAAAKLEPQPLEPSMSSSGWVSTTGVARTAPKGCPSGHWSVRNAMSSAACCGKSSAVRASRERRRAKAVSWSVPGARPSPRSMRPGWSISRVLNHSATFRGEWLGSMIPAAPTRIPVVAPAMWAMRISGELLPRPTKLWCSEIQNRW